MLNEPKLKNIAKWADGGVWFKTIEYWLSGFRNASEMVKHVF